MNPAHLEVVKQTIATERPELTEAERDALARELLETGGVRLDPGEGLLVALESSDELDEVMPLEGERVAFKHRVYGFVLAVTEADELLKREP